VKYVVHAVEPRLCLTPHFVSILKFQANPQGANWLGHLNKVTVCSWLVLVRFTKECMTSVITDSGVCQSFMTTRQTFCIKLSIIAYLQGCFCHTWSNKNYWYARLNVKIKYIYYFKQNWTCGSVAILLYNIQFTEQYPTLKYDITVTMLLHRKVQGQSRKLTFSGLPCLDYHQWTQGCQPRTSMLIKLDLLANMKV
jgi:hypothetical protein